MQKIKILSLKNQKSFNFVSKDAIKYTGKYFIILFSDLKKISTSSAQMLPILSKKSPSSDSKNILLGFKVTKKIGNSVTRNLIKRRIKAIIRELSNHIEDHTVIIFIAKRDLPNLSYSDILLNFKKSLFYIQNKKNYYETTEI